MDYQQDEREQRTLRDRVADLERTDDAIPDPSGCLQPILVQTVTKTSYPTAAASYFAVQQVEPGGTEGEGNTATLTAISGVFYCLNVGSAIPPVGTYLIAIPSGGRWVINYRG